MNIKMTNAAIIEILQSLGKFDGVSGKLGYAISRTKNNMVREIKPFEDMRDNLFRKYAEKDENGNPTSIKPNTDGFKNFIEEITPISQIAIDIDVFQISQEEFDKSDSYSEAASVKDYDVLQLFIKKEEKQEDKDNEDNEVSAD